MPHLFGIPKVVGSAQGREQRAAIALAMLDAGVASPALWKRGYTSPDVFLKKALNIWVAVRCDDAVRERFPMRIRLDSELDPWSSATSLTMRHQREEMRPGGPVYLALESEAAAFFTLGATFDWLARFDAQLPATVYHRLSQLKRALYVYDWYNAMEHDLMHAENYEGEDLASYREDNPEITAPPCLKRQPLSAGQVQLRRRAWSADVCRVVDAAADVASAAKAVTFGTKREREARYQALVQGDYTRTSPSLVIATEEGDRVCAAFDDEMMDNDGCPPEPLRFWIIDRPTQAAVRHAFDELDQVLRAIAAATQFFEAIPGKGKVAPDSLAGGLSQLDGPGEGCAPVRVRVA